MLKYFLHTFSMFKVETEHYYYIITHVQNVVLENLLVKIKAS